MKRWMVFAGDTYYPAGGMSDFVGSYDDQQEARAAAKEQAKRNKWAQVADRDDPADIEDFDGGLGSDERQGLATARGRAGG